MQRSNLDMMKRPFLFCFLLTHIQCQKNCLIWFGFHVVSSLLEGSLIQGKTTNQTCFKAFFYPQVWLHAIPPEQLQTYFLQNQPEVTLKHVICWKSINFSIARSTLADDTCLYSHENKPLPRVKLCSEFLCKCSFNHVFPLPSIPEINGVPICFPQTACLIP